MLTILVCPKCKNTLKYSPGAKEIFCIKDKLAFPIRNGVPVLLISDARQVNAEKGAHAKKHAPIIELIE
jgi:LSD1 subclass zinc finger protein